MFNVNRRSNQFLYAGKVLDGDDALAELLSSNTNSETLVKPILTLTLALAQTLHLFLNIIIKDSHCYIYLLHQVHMN